MLAGDMNSYGSVAVEAEAPARRSVSKSVIALAAVALMVVGVVALSGSTNASLRTTVDSNRNRAMIAKVSPEVREVGLKVLNMTVNQLRWAVIGFNLNQDEIIPLMTGLATNDWEKDFLQFRNALPEDAACVAVYNFEYWLDETETELDPIMITWSPPNMDPAALANAGYFLGAEILALNTDEGRLNTELINTGTSNDAIGKDKGKGYGKAPERTGFSGPYRLASMSETYNQFCEQEMALGPKICSLDKTFHNCPFESEDEAAWTDANPCKQDACAGGAFGNPDAAELDSGRTIPDACCEYITTDFCAPLTADGVAGAGVGQMGCHPATLTALAKLCESSEEPTLTVIKGSYDDLKNCGEQCKSSCKLFNDPNDTFKECDGCAIEGMFDEATGQTSQCYPGAFGYVMDMCCGFSDDCVTFDGAALCGTQEYNQCEWIAQLECQSLKDEQELAGGTKGCCVIANPEDEGFGVDNTYDAERNMLECGGDAKDGSTRYSTLDGQEAVFTAAALDLDAAATCAKLQADAQALKDAADAAAAAAAAVTTAAPERRV